MTFKDYLKHYLEIPDFVIFMLLTALLLVGVYCIFYLYAKTQKKEPALVKDEFFSLSERFYELIFSGGSIIGFMAVYYLINRFVTEGAFYSFWSKYKDYLLLVLMIISISFNTFLDHVLIKLKKLDREGMAPIRLVGMLYMIIIFGYIKFIYEDDNYDMFIAYFLTLMVGRFVYFDASFKDFVKCMKAAAANIPIMLLGLTYLGIMCAYGYFTGYLLKHNGVITNIFLVHVYLVVVIFILHFAVEALFSNKNKNHKTKSKND
ncbi:MAG: hypothetical protein K6F37_01405 [Lachnospiraceae bacterium]|nr:hypothetical protein [Lachnospiraceae bacterium]